MFTKIFRRFFLIFPLDIRRIIILGFFIVPLYFTILVEPDEDSIIFDILFFVLLYVSLIVVIAWIYEGFKIGKNDN